jgi:ABC-type phosphate/phosphonate transport system permease subunit
MTGVLALAQGLAPTVVVPYLGMFCGGIMALALGLIAARRFLAAPPSHGYVLDINAVRAQASAAQADKRAA